MHTPPLWPGGAAAIYLGLEGCRKLRGLGLECSRDLNSPGCGFCLSGSVFASLPAHFTCALVPHWFGGTAKKRQGPRFILARWSLAPFAVRACILGSRFGGARCSANHGAAWRGGIADSATLRSPDTVLTALIPLRFLNILNILQRSLQCSQAVSTQLRVG